MARANLFTAIAQIHVTPSSSPLKTSLHVLNPNDTWFLIVNEKKSFKMLLSKYIVELLDQPF